MTKSIIPIEIPETPITDKMFIRQGWERYIHTEPEKDEDDDIEDAPYYWVLPLPKDNPDELAVCLISSESDESEEISLPIGTYVVEIANSNGIGICITEEEVEMLYQSLTGRDINSD
jgi:hypothetical protein